LPSATSGPGFSPARQPAVFHLFGYAGTGKTTLSREIEAIAREGGEDKKKAVMYGAFTGKAALVMRQKGCKGASSIRSMIYTRAGWRAAGRGPEEDHQGNGGRIMRTERETGIDNSINNGLNPAAAKTAAGSIWWGKKDSNLRSHKTADLQSAPFATRDTPPRRHRTASTKTMVERPRMTLKTRAR
jgi:hypothetical protein